MSTRSRLKKIISGYPWIYERLLDVKYSQKPLDHVSVRDSTPDSFTEKYFRNAWGDSMSRSGPGSNLDYTRDLRTNLEKFLRNYSINSMLDAPCGDFVWMGRVGFPPQFNYIGADIVGPLVEKLRTTYGSANRRFVQIDVTKDDLPKVDLWVCRDCLIHLSNEDVTLALHNFVRSNIRFFMTTTYNFGRFNTDIVTGDFRQINLRRPPFSLPRPIEMIKDFVFPFPPRRLAVWSRCQLTDWAASCSHSRPKGNVEAASPITDTRKVR